MSKPNEGELRKILLERAFKEIKKYVSSGVVPPNMALSMLAEATGQLKNRDEDLKRFVENSTGFITDDKFFESGYPTRSATGYTYREPSHSDQIIFYHLYKHLSNQEYESPEQLKDIMKNLVKGKKILELGCGPGFTLDLFQRLGAKTTGVELRTKYRGRLGLDIRYGGAERLDQLVDEKYDIIYSKDFFCTAVLEPRESISVARRMAVATAEQGTGLHIAAYEKYHPIIERYIRWLNSQQMGISEEQEARIYNRLTDDEKADASWVNTFSLDPQHLLREGLSLEKYAIENGFLVCITKR